MSGHSKWSTIKRKKEKTDAQRANVFTKIGREIAVAVRESGADPTVNFKLRDLIAKAKANNIPYENIERTIKKSSGSGEKNDYEEIVYEGYGPNGVALIVESLTDNRNRTAGDIRHYFDKFGGNLGTTGCVSFMFRQRGVIVLDGTLYEENKVMDDALSAGADDLSSDEDVYEIFTDPANFSEVADTLQKVGYEFLSAQVEYVPDTYVALNDEDHVKKMNLLLEHLEENDDVQNVWHNWDNPDN